MTNAVERSLELAGETAGDITPLVYARLFAERPETEAMFWRDADGSIRGEMLARVLEALLDFAGPRQYAHSLIQCEVIRHDNEMDTPPDLFGSFFGVIAATVRDVLGPAWTADIEAAWAKLLTELDYYVRNPDQHATAVAAGAARL